jgi:3-hydroxypropanoate dehydrogenase
MNTTTAQLFTAARTPAGWLDTPVTDDTLRALYDLLKWGPTAANSSPARIVFVRSPEGKTRLLDCVAAGNASRVQAAPVTAIVGMDMGFYEHMPLLYPQTDARSWYAGKPAMIQDTAFRNSSLQGAYLIMAARALGLDAGPMSGFDAAKIDAAFFADSSVKSNFICTLGHADAVKVRPRNPRLPFETACTLA